MILINKKVLAASAVAIMFLPFMASAHGVGLAPGSVVGQGSVSVGFNANAGSMYGHNSKDNDGDKGKSWNKAHFDGASTDASTTAAVVVKKATRINSIADFMSSLSSTVSTRIANAGLSASDTATANAQLTEYNTGIANAKVQANAALTAANSVNANNATSTNAGFITTAQADIKAAHNFLSEARKNLMSILHAIFNA